MSTRFITTAIPYVNARPHIGFALELVQADVLARASREAHGKESVRFLTGTDENAIKNVQAAEKAETPVQQFVDQNAGTFLSLCSLLNISNDDFIRTTEARHAKGAQMLWLACKEDIYEKEYSGLYCTGCEAFYLEKDLVDGKCPEHKTVAETVKEKNYFFKLSKYQRWLEDRFAKGAIRIHPASRASETINFIKSGLEDFSISRSNKRAKNWGVSVPDDATQKLYVWFDALANYITALDYKNYDGSENADAYFTKFWFGENAHVTHVIGKGITKFHAIYWPAMLHAAGIFPKNGIDIFVHGYVTVNGEKISKSLGNTVDPFALVEKYGADAVRYFLVREIPTFEDGDFSEEKFVLRYNADLANGIGNFIQRVTTLAEKFGVSTIDPADFEKAVAHAEGSLGHLSNDVEQPIAFALAEIMKLVKEGDGYMETHAPYKKDTTSEERARSLASLLYLASHIAHLLRPFMPQTSRIMLERLAIDPAIRTIDPSLTVHPTKGEPLFRRI